MDSINSLGYPLVYKAQHTGPWIDDLSDEGIAIRTEVRALDGMQKEALVYYTPTKTVWRMVSDEGPYLNGTDLSPFPLAFYTAGMAFSFVTELLKHAASRAVDLSGIELIQDNFYTMEGSALRGDMTGGALPAELAIKADLDNDQLQALVDKAVKSSPPQAYNRKVLDNIFSLTLNDESIPVTGIKASDKSKVDPGANFRLVGPESDTPREDIIVKLRSAETLFNVDGGAGSSLKSEQKRTLHVRGVVTVRKDGLLECNVQLFKPIGSTFRFLCDYQDGDLAPPPLAYLSAGVGFCFMTQVGRYATIVKQKIKAYRIVQDNTFTFDGNEAVAHPIDTHLFIDMNETTDEAQKLLGMSEQTCFLHAAMRSEVPSNVGILTADAISEAQA